MDTPQVVAHQPDRRSVRLWVDLGDRAEPLSLRVVDGRDVQVRRWTSPVREAVHAGRRRDARSGGRFPGVHVWDVHELEPGSPFRVEDEDGNRLATFRTLPEHLPLTVVVGSCYSVDDDRADPVAGHPPPPPRFRRARYWSRRAAATAAALVPRPRREPQGRGAVAVAYEALARDLERRGRPVDLKLLLGDQVYVDQPPWSWVVPRDVAGSWRLVGARYRATWRRLGPLLSCGANICVSEDHEYWNNYPSPPAWLRLWPASRLRLLRKVAEVHRQCFQQTAATRAFDVGHARHVSFFVADTRCRRTEVRQDGDGFMDDCAFGKLVAWLDGLDGPGVVVLGQPLLAAAGRPRIDTTLANYEAQYRRLCDAISAAGHDVVVLCGDVHYGRRTVVPLVTGTTLVEVVSSPMAVLASAGKIAEQPVAPEPLRAERIAEVDLLDAERPDGTGEDHLTVLTFDEADDGVRLRVTPYYTRFCDETGVPRCAADWPALVLR